jgi:hypothetical protein
MHGLAYGNEVEYNGEGVFNLGKRVKVKTGTIVWAYCLWDIADILTHKMSP